jgi:histidine triad (HIT) family protein
VLDEVASMRYFRILALRAARGPIGRVFISWTVTHMSFVIPARRLRETKTLVAFSHPQPAHQLHILLVPKRALGGLVDLTPADSDFTTDLFATVQSLVAEFGLERTGYRLIANGGAYQDVPQLHFHLIADILPEGPEDG